MKLAQRMVGIGTETAFEAAARARALEAQGRHIVHREIGEPDIDTFLHRATPSRTAMERSLGITGFILGNPLYQYESRIYRVTFDGANLASGVYVSQVQTPTQVITKKMMLMKFAGTRRNRLVVRLPK